LIKFLKDLVTFIRFKFSNTKFEIGFFCESKFIYNYLEPFILKKIQNNKKILIFCFENFENKNLKDTSIIVLNTDFFRELFFLTLKLKYLYSSTPDLENTIFKRTKFSKCKYIYLSHSPVSLTLIYNESAFDYFDAVQVTSKFQYDELSEIIKNRNLKTKKFRYPYLFVKNQIKKIRKIRSKIDILIAPSWNTSFYSLNCHILLKKFLDRTNLTYEFRPHPMSIKKNEISFDALKSMNIPIDQSNFLEFSKYKYFISDWSGIFIEYALIFKRKAYLINTKSKIVNDKYLKYKNKPIEITLRNILAKAFEIENIEKLVNEINLSTKKILPEDKINGENEVKDLIDKNFY